ncbi:MAG: ABC transporter permease, partial [SAR324 cluster bacterium]|nr:ABC transporter permease [SAR324 cluster bacterium]
MSLKLKKLMGWEGFLLVVLLLIISVNSFHSPAFLTVENQVNLFVLSVEKIIIALIMTFIILNAEIDLSV